MKKLFFCLQSFGRSFALFLGCIICYSCNHEEPETSHSVENLSLGSSVLSSNQILYTTTDGYPLDFFSEYLYISNVLSHTTNGCGTYLITFDKNLNHIAAAQFASQKRLKGIQLPNGVVEIKSTAFADCSNLQDVYLPNSLINIEEEAFSDCRKLLNISLGDGLMSIGSDVFYNCVNLMEVAIPETVEEIDGNTFYGCDNLANFKGKFASSDGRCLIVDGHLIAFAPKDVITYTFPSEVIAIDSRSVVSDELTVIEIPHTVTEISSHAFNCRNLLSFKGKYASSDNRCLIYDNILIAFAEQGITEYSVPDGVEKIDNSVFSFCNNLTRIELPNSLTIIGNSAFCNCWNLERICISEGIDSIGENAFEGCFSLIDISLPASIKSIGRGAFHGCSGIESIVLPQGLKEIEEYTFCNCTNLSSIYIPESINKIGDAAFSYCGFNQLNIPDNISYIGAYAFSGCDNLEYLELGTDILEIHDNAFECWNLGEIYCHSSKPAILGTDVFTRRYDTNMKIYVPEESLVQYKTNEFWKIYSDYIVGHKF